MMLRATILFVVTFCFSVMKLEAQQLLQADSLPAISYKYLEEVSSRADKISGKIDRQSEKALAQLQKQEEKLKRKLAKIDSSKAKQLFGDVTGRYKELGAGLKNKARSARQYIPSLDTLSTSLKFLQENNSWLSKVKDSKQQVTQALDKVKGLEQNFQKAENIKQYLKERRQYIKQQLSKYGLVKHMKKLDKEVYYYSQSLKEYKEILKDPSKMERKAVALLRKVPAFEKFMNKNSQYASLFGIPSGSGTPGNLSFAGLQTRVSAQQMIQQFISVPPQQFIDQQLNDAQGKMAAYKNAIDIDLPDWQDNLGDIPKFKVNRQKGKPFLKRFEWGSNIQFGRANNFLPTAAELAFSLGYKLNDQGVIGIGSSYKLGLGTGFQNIRLTHQGFGMRSYIDWKIKGGFYVSGGYEKNYLPQLADINLSGQADIWQQSGLVGASKKYSISKKRKGYVQLLFDFLSYQNIPRSQPVIFRTGINF